MTISIPISCIWEFQFFHIRINTWCHLTWVFAALIGVKGHFMMFNLFFLLVRCCGIFFFTKSGHKLTIDKCSKLKIEAFLLRGRLNAVWFTFTMEYYYVTIKEKGATEWDGWMASPTRCNRSLSKLWKMVKDREAWCSAAHGVAKGGHDWTTEQQEQKRQSTSQVVS